MRKRIWLITAMIIVVAIVTHPAYLLYMSKGTATLTVSEFKARAESVYDQRSRVEGTVAAGSVDWDEEIQVLRFSLAEGNERLNVLHRGIVPDSFKPGADVILEGTYRADGVFEATNLNGSRSVCAFCH